MLKFFPPKHELEDDAMLKTALYFAANRIKSCGVPAGMSDCLQPRSPATMEMKLVAVICTDSMFPLFRASRLFVDVHKFHLSGHMHLLQSFLENGAYFNFPSLQNKIETTE